MKLLLCMECQMVFSLSYDERSCACEATKGRYDPDGLHARYSGPGLPLGFANDSFVWALARRPQDGRGLRFEAFVIPIECDTFVREEG